MRYSAIMRPAFSGGTSNKLRSKQRLHYFAAPLWGPR